MKIRTLVSLSTTVVLTGLLAPSAALADDSPADVAAARQLGVEGVQLADKGKCADAVEKLERAEKLHHAPTTAERLGECDIELGHLVAGTEILQRLVREQLGPNPPAAFTASVQKAQKLLPTVLPRIGKLHVTVAAPPGSKFGVKVDGQPLSDALVDADRPTDPGMHTVEASGAGLLTASQKVTLKEGETQKVPLTLEADPNAATAAPVPVVPEGGGAGAASGAPAQPAAGQAPSTVGTEPPPESAPASRSTAPAFVAFGVGAIGIGVGAVTGVLAMSKASSIDKACPSKQCPATEQSDLDSAKTLGTVSTVGFIIGGVGVVAGVLLLVTGNPPSSASASKTARVERLTSSTVSVEPVVGARYLGLHGSF